MSDKQTTRAQAKIDLMTDALNAEIASIERDGTMRATMPRNLIQQ